MRPPGGIGGLPYFLGGKGVKAKMRVIDCSQCGQVLCFGLQGSKEEPSDDWYGGMCFKCLQDYLFGRLRWQDWRKEAELGRRPQIEHRERMSDEELGGLE